VERKEFPIKRGEEPRLGLGFVSKLMPASRPQKKSLLRKIGRGGFGSRQAERESIQRRIPRGDKVFEFNRVHRLPSPKGI
jgi:hypothetical protein